VTWSRSMPAKSSGLRVQRKTVRYGHRRDHRVVGACNGLPSGTAQRSRDLAERAGRSSIEGEWGEVGFRLLQMSLSRGALCLRTGDEGADGRLGQRDDRDQRLDGQHGGVPGADSRITVFVCSSPRSGRSCGLVTATDPATRRRPHAAGWDRLGEADASARAAPRPSPRVDPAVAVQRPACPIGSR
jgi:hypothetical protein